MSGKKAIEVLEKVFSGVESEEMPNEIEIKEAISSLKQVIESKKVKGYTIDELEKYYKEKKARLIMTPDFLRELRRDDEKAK